MRFHRKEKHGASSPASYPWVWACSRHVAVATRNPRRHGRLRRRRQRLDAATAIRGRRGTLAFALAGCSSGTLKGGDRGFTFVLTLKPEARSPRSHPQRHAQAVPGVEVPTRKVRDRGCGTGKSKTAVDAPLSDYRTGGFSGLLSHSIPAGSPLPVEHSGRVSTIGPRPLFRHERTRVKSSGPMVLTRPECSHRQRLGTRPYRSGR